MALVDGSAFWGREDPPAVDAFVGRDALNYGDGVKHRQQRAVGDGGGRREGG